jgi:putative transposase
MARHVRLMLPGCPLHVIQRGHLRQPCFFNRSDYIIYRDWLHEYSSFHGVAIHAYVLMSNHVHLLISADAIEPVSALMKGVSQKYAQLLNRRFERKGTWWEGRFRSSPVPVEEYFLICQRYIELNPVRAGMVNCAEAYRWSSHHGNTGTLKDDLITPHPTFLGLGREPENRYATYRKLFASAILPSQLDAIRAAVLRNHPVGQPPKTRRNQNPAGQAQ